MGQVNDQGQSLDPVNEGFRAPAGFSGPILPPEGHDFYRDWVGSMMGNTARDPAFFATLNVANQDIIDYYNSLDDAGKAAFRTEHKLPDNANEDMLPVTADICLRCHAPVGWLEAHSEPATPAFPFLKGQFWGAALEEAAPTNSVELRSEAEMEGVQCDFCHRAYAGNTRESLLPGSDATLMAGNGSLFVSLDIPFRENGGIPDTVFPFQKTGDFCGTCHDVTNPILKTRTEVAGVMPDMLHPMERTYTEWYWSGFRDTKRCQDCHAPMQFLGAQTWMLSPAMDRLWGDVDQQWVDRGYDVPASRAEALSAAAARNRTFMKEKAAKVEILGAPTRVSPGDEVSVDVKVTNLTGHKLPTGFAEGRQMWIHLHAKDKNGKLVWEDGALAPGGALVRTDQTKVYEQEILAEGYDFIDDKAKDLDKDGVISPEELEKAQHFHFVLMNKIIKDNRIPPKGYNKAAYQADGAFIVPAETYADGQYWDTTRYRFTVPAGVKDKIVVTATLKYQTFNREYAEFLRDHDQEPTQKGGGRARNLPEPFATHNGVSTWGQTLHTLWKDAGNGRPVSMASANRAIRVTNP